LFIDTCNKVNCIVLQSGELSFDPSKPVAVTMIQKEADTSIYFNAVPLTYYRHDILFESIKEIRLNFVDDELNTGIEKLEYDNIKIWDLDKIENK